MNDTQHTQLPEKYKNTAKFWNDCWEEEGLFEKLPEKVQAELSDFEQAISTWSKVAYHITGGTLSKPNYTYDSYVEVFDEYMEEVTDEALHSQASQMLKDIEGMKRELGLHDGHRNDDRCWCYNCEDTAPEEEFTENGMYNRALDDVISALKKKYLPVESVSIEKHPTGGTE